MMIPRLEVWRNALLKINFNLPHNFSFIILRVIIVSKFGGNQFWDMHKLPLV